MKILHDVFQLPLPTKIVQANLFLKAIRISHSHEVHHRIVFELDDASPRSPAGLKAFAARPQTQNYDLISNIISMQMPSP